MSHTALISGASVAGPTLALLLARAGWRVTVVERAGALREEGQNVDVRLAGREVARRLGVEAAIRDANTTETGTEFVDADGEVVSRFAPDGDAAPTAELEILRGQLSRVLVDRCGPEVEWVFGDAIAAVDADTGDVRLASGREERFDVVAVAEGMRSSTRELCFEDVRLEPLGLDIAYLTIPRTPADTSTWRVFVAPDERQIHLRPDNLGSIRAMLAFLADPGADTRGRHEQVALLRERFAGAGWEADRVLAELDGAEDLYYESLAQVHAGSWRRGRVVLLGDAAHCVTPLGGFGASLALIGGYVLAGELATTPEDVGGACARYEERLRPLAEEAQDLPPGVPDLAYPSSKLGGDVLRLASKVAASRVGRALTSLAPDTSDDFDLPDYPALRLTG